MQVAGFLDMAQQRVRFDGSFSDEFDNKTYRVKLCYDTESVNVMCFGMFPVDRDIEGKYDSVEELPEWMQGKLASLSILPPPPPPQNIEDLGARISKSIYWVYHV